MAPISAATSSPANWKENRVDRRLAQHQTGKRRVVVIARERNGKTLSFVFKAEGESLETLGKRIEVGSIVHADEAAHWDALHSRYLTKRINHQETYSDGEACTNQAESFFSRLRRAEIGTHHHIAGPYLKPTRPKWLGARTTAAISNGEQYLLAVNAALAHPVSPPVERLLAARCLKKIAVILMTCGLVAILPQSNAK